MLMTELRKRFIKDVKTKTAPELPVVVVKLPIKEIIAEKVELMEGLIERDEEVVNKQRAERVEEGVYKNE